MSKKMLVLVIIAISLIILGITLLLYPYADSYVYEQSVEVLKKDFVVEITKKENENILDKLYEELIRRNEYLYTNKQESLDDPFSYEQSTIDLKEYGIENNIIAYIRIPKIDIELPILLGANTQHLKLGAAHLTHTSYPIGGENTNCVIAAHRGYRSSDMFINLHKLEFGDKIYIKNFKEELEYSVYGIRLVTPDDNGELFIEEGDDIITLITCHPYRVNTHRYIVRAKRIV